MSESIRESIQALLASFRGLDPLKRLFWQELNYDRVNEPISSRDWAEADRVELAADPLLLAEHADFKVIYAQMRGALSRTAERAIVTQLLKAFPYALFVFSDAAQQSWHFVNVKYERDPRRRRVFRRISVAAGGTQLRTATERLAMLDLATVSRDLFGIPPLAIQQRHDQAFDVEAVTAEFFREYRKVFTQVEAFLADMPEEPRRLFVQKLFNRLMFIVFLERKGWLSFRGRTDYLRALWEDYTARRDAGDEENFYWNRLNVLFFSGLNNPQGLALQPDRFPATAIGSVPYLNGGLFEKDDTDENGSVRIPDEVFAAAIEDIFYRFNFTIAESTPLDVEVAVDPEMLGKIFEELVTGRHESGSYYTPKAVVSFMCREGLKGYLRAQLPAEPQAALAHFVDEYDATSLRDPERVLDALRRVTVCDPACGSGAYLLGMLQELLLLRDALFTARNVDARSVYDRKLEIIQRSIYGVDKEAFATNIAQLRLWLSLIVEYERSSPQDAIPTLPNLDYKIEVGDSLLGPDPSGASPSEFDRLLVEKFVQAKDAFLKAHGPEKQRLHAEVEQLRADIRAWSRSGVAADAFDWVMEFAEVFQRGGFDIVLANPPYVRMELFKDIKTTLRKNFPDAHSDRADLYIYFYARAVQMLSSKGMLVFISSNKWLHSDYGGNLRYMLSNTMTIESITDFGDLPVFSSATAYPMILVAQKDNKHNYDVLFTPVESLGEPYPDVSALVRRYGYKLPVQAVKDHNWILAEDSIVEIVLRMMDNSQRLGKYVDQIYWGVKTGLNEAFIIDEPVYIDIINKSEMVPDIIKPLAMGRDIKRWRISYPKKWLIYTHHGVDISQYPAVLEYLQPFRQQLERRATKQPWYELQQPQERYITAFESPKIVMPDIAKGLRFAFDPKPTYLGNTAYFIPSSDLYLLGVLNSKCVEIFYSTISSQIRGGYFRFFRQYVEQIPIPEAPPKDREAITMLVQRCLDKQGVGCEDEERELDERVARLYGVELPKE